MFQNALLKKKKTYSKTQQLFYKISILPKLVHICFLKHHITADVIQKSPWFIEINTLDPPAEVATTMTWNMFFRLRGTHPKASFAAATGLD